MVMASLVLVPPSSPLWSSASTSSKLRSFSPLRCSSSFYRLDLGHFRLRNGLQHLGISITRVPLGKARRGKCRSGVAVRASFFGVGAPEALVIGVVALLVFGPKGLAEVARNFGKTLRAFQPTIRELQDVSREFKSTLEREIGFDETSSPMQNTSPSRTNIASPPPSTKNPQALSDVNGVSSPNRAYTSEEYLKLTVEQLKAAALEERQKELSTPDISPPETESQPKAADEEVAGTMPPPVEPKKEV